MRNSLPNNASLLRKMHVSMSLGEHTSRLIQI